MAGGRRRKTYDLYTSLPFFRSVFHPNCNEQLKMFIVIKTKRGTSVLTKHAWVLRLCTTAWLMRATSRRREQAIGSQRPGH